MDFGPKMNID